MSADEKTYIEAKLEDLDKRLSEIHGDVKHINGALNSIAVQQVAISGRVSNVEEEARKHHCPRAGLCVELEREIVDLKGRISVFDSDKKAAYSVWKVIATVGGAAVGFTATVWAVIEIVRSLFKN